MIGLAGEPGKLDFASAFPLVTTSVNLDCGYPSSIVLKDGRVIEDGPPAALIRNGGHYSGLVKKEARLLAIRAA